VWEGEDGANTVYMWMKWENDVGAIPGTGGRWTKENDGGGEFKYDIFDLL
jgi:hypothetical protein